MAEIWVPPVTWAAGGGNDDLSVARLNMFRDSLKFLHDKGGDLTAATTVSPTNQYHKVTGNTTIQSITAGTAGSRVTFWLTGTPTIKHATGNIQLGGSDYICSANSVLSFICDGTNWWLEPSAAPGGPGRTIDFVSKTVQVQASGTTSGTATDVLVGATLAYDASPKRVYFFAPGSINTTGNNLFEIYRGGTILGRVVAVALNTVYVYFCIEDRTPSAGSYKYKVTLYVTGGTGTVQAGSGGASTLLPMTMAVVQA